MKQYTIGKHGIIRCWINDLPLMPRRYGMMQHNGMGHPGMQIRRNELTALAYELYLPTGGRVRYGMLGGSIACSEDQLTQVSVVYEPQVEEIWRQSLVAGPEYAYTGLPQQYVEAAFDGAQKGVSALETIYGNCVVLNCAAQTMTGSSENIFRNLAQLIVLTLGYRETQLTDETMVQCILHSVI